MSKINDLFNDMSIRITDWIGSTTSVIVHTVFFAGIFSLYFFGFDIPYVLLLTTTLVSFEAIYLCIFLQMTANRNTKSLEDVGQDIEDMTEDIDLVRQEDIKDNVYEEATTKALNSIILNLQKLQEDRRNKSR